MEFTYEIMISISQQCYVKGNRMSNNIVILTF